MKYFSPGSYLSIFLFCLCFCSAPGLRAQTGLLPGTTGPETSPQVAWQPDSLGRRNPRGAVAGFIQAVAAENYNRAALYLRLNSSLKKKQNKVALARSLQQLLDNGAHVLPYSMISDDPAGSLDDNLGPNLEKVGTASVNNEDFDIILERSDDADGGPIWMFSPETIQRLPLLVEEAPIAPLIDRVSPSAVEGIKWGGVPVAHWFGGLVLLLLAYISAWIITHLVIFLVPFVYRKAKTEPTAGILKAFGLPVRIYITIWLFSVAMSEAGISIILRQGASGVMIIVAIVAVMLLLWQLIDVLTRFFERKLTHHRNQAGVSAILFLRRTAKVALIILAFILILDTAGFDVTTGLAALGIGGIALALGAQKTVENFVGSVTLIADQPIRVGDFCKVGDISGTVEQIGMRSTRIRTGERTTVTIPNGDFASQKIENFAPRDKFLFNSVFRLRLETSPEQIRYLLVELRSILYAHPKVDPLPARVRFIEIGADALKLEVYAYVKALSYDEFLEIREDLFLRMMDVVNSSGTAFAMPSQRIYLSPDKALPSEKQEEAEARVKKWREAGEIQIPNFDPDRIDDLKDSIDYPAEGSAQGKGKQSRI